MKRFLILALAAVLACHAQAQPVDAGLYRVYISSDTIASRIVGRDVQGPPNGTVRMYYDWRDKTPGGFAGKDNAWNGDWSTYIRPGSALGRDGPLGYLGPLSSIGPIGPVAGTFSWMWGYPWNAMLSGSFVWSDSPAFTAQGPLGNLGPLTEQKIYTTMYHINQSGDYANSNGSDDKNDFPHQLDPSGIWGILGPAGPLGALGPLGPLGPNGYGKIASIDWRTGDYQLSGQTVRTLEPPGTSRRYELVELYPRGNLVSRQMTPTGFVNDTSFSVNAVDLFCLSGYGNADDHIYYFRSAREQWVSIVLSNANGVAEFDFDVYIKPDAYGTAAFKNSANAKTWFGSRTKVFSVSGLSGLQNFALVRAKGNEVFKVVVRPSRWVGTAERCGYMFHVTGSGFQEQVTSSWAVDSRLFAPNRFSGGITTFNITGPHQEIAERW